MIRRPAALYEGDRGNRMTTKILSTLRSEREVLRQVLEVLAMFGIDADRRNTGVGTNPRGQTVRFGTPGDSDVKGVLPDGRALHLETKREGWRPPKGHGRAAQHWQRQLERLRRTNAAGGVGLWIESPERLAAVLPKLLAGWRVEIDERGMCFVVDGDG